nr:MAG TPA: Large Terminase [Caudoviricetes sp.]
MIKKREVIVGYWIKKQVQNLIEDMDDSRYIYDTTEAHKRIKFQETLCLQSKAPYYMKPISLMPWQKAWWEAVYSFKMADTGLRRFTEGLLEVARKNGKSTMFAADGNTDLFAGEGGTSICCASNDDRQAKLIWLELAGMRQRLDPKKVMTSQNLTEILNKKKNIVVFRLSSKTQNKDGFNITKTYLDESHDIAEENAQSEIAEACWRGMSSQDEPLFLNCTTNGFNRDCYLDHKIDYAKKVIRGEIDDIHFIAFLYEQDSEEEIWQDEESWEKSNPSIRYGVKKISKLRRDIETAKYDKATRIHMLTKDFNIPQSNAQSWLMLEDYDYHTTVYDLEEFRGALILGAVDLSATTDLSNAKILLMKPNDKTKYIYSHYWIPESKLTNSDDSEAGAEYMEWTKKGFLTIHDGSEIDISKIADWFFQLYKDYGLRPYRIGYDQRFAKTFIDRCNEYTFETEMIQQGKFLSSAMKLTEAELKSRVINYQENAVDKWCLKNCACKVDDLGNMQPVKINSNMRIDGAVTLIMLFETLRRYRSDFISQIK